MAIDSVMCINKQGVLKYVQFTYIILNTTFIYRFNMKSRNPSRNSKKHHHDLPWI